MARIYSASRVIFNCSLRNDVNMRVFESLACGGFLMTNDLTANGLAELLVDGRELATYKSADELLDKIRFYLSHDDLRRRISQAGRATVLKYHTYFRRMRTILEECCTTTPTGVVVSVVGPQSTNPQRQPVVAAATLNPPQLAGSQQVKPISRTPLTSIILVTHNEWNYTAACIASIRRSTPQPFELIVVDNASTDATTHVLRKDTAIRLICNSENRGFPAAANQGLCASTGDVFVLLNNDTLVPPGWLRPLLQAASDPQIGLVGPVSNQVSGPQQIQVPYVDVDLMEVFAADWSSANAGVRVASDRLVGFCLAFRRDVVDRIGLLDERFGIGNFEDDDYCLRARRANFQNVIAVDSFVHHFGHRSFIGSGVDFGEILRANQLQFEQKWGPLAEATTPSLQPGTASTPPAAMATAASPRPLRAQSGFHISRYPQGGLRLSLNRRNLSLCMIVRDNDKTIGAALASIYRWVDEIIIVDTGSTDRTIEICRSYGARVEYFQWCDDFSAARNESLKYATGDWIFWMDSDDTIPEDCSRQLRQLVDGPHEDAVLGYVMQVHCPGPGHDNDGGAEVTVVDHLKLFRRVPGLVFERRIHEQLLPSIHRLGGEYRWTDLYVVHSGYDHSTATRAKKLERDLRILNLERAQEPNHPFLLFNLGMTYADARRWDRAIEDLRRCIEVSAPHESQVPKAHALLINALFQAELFDEALQACETALSSFPDDKEIRFRHGLVEMAAGRFESAARAFEVVLECPAERKFLSVDRHLAGYKARHNLAIARQATGDHAAALSHWRRVLDEQPGFRPAIRGAAESMIELDLREDLLAFLDELAANHSTAPAGRVVAALDAAARGDAVGRQAALRAGRLEFPSDVELMREWCRYRFEEGDWREAAIGLRELVDHDPDDPSARLNLAIALVRAGSPDEAVAHVERSLELRPGHESALELARTLRTNGGAD
jgi:glycosyltransferase involved in cell wall biosynthesis